MEFEFELIEKIKPRPALFLGELSVSKLRAFLHGYGAAIDDYNIKNPRTIQPLPFWFFHEYVARRYGFFESTSGWLNMILKQVNSEEEGLALFFELFNDFKHLKIESLYSCVITQKHLDFHCDDKYSPKQFIGDKHDIGIPIYQNVQKIYYACLSNHIDYISFVETEKEYKIRTVIYETKKDITEYWQSCFGDSLVWQNQKYDSMVFNKKRVI